MTVITSSGVVASLNKALDQVRAAEAKRLAAEGYEPQLKQTRWCLLKRKANLTSKQRLRLRDVLRYDLVTVRAYLKVQALPLLWEYTSSSCRAAELPSCRVPSSEFRVPNSGGGGGGGHVIGCAVS